MDSESHSETSDLETLATLAEPVRRALYEYVVSAHEPVSRDDAARAVDVSRQVAAYHLDRLAEDGLLAFEFRRLTGKEGPGAGRPAKLYRRSRTTYDVSVPPRRYALAASVLLEALREGDVSHDALAAVARGAGSRIGGADGLDGALDQTGYEPVVEEGKTRFRNCPFHLLRDQDRELTCALNLALVEGMIEGAGADASATLAPEEGYCCVRIDPAV